MVVGSEEDLSRVQVTVDEAAAMGVIDAGRRLAQEPERPLPAQGAAAYPTGQGAALDVLQDQVGLVPQLSEVQDADQVRMPERGQRPEAGPPLLGEALQHLHRDRAAAGVVAAENGTQRALTEVLVDLVAAQPAAGVDHRHAGTFLPKPASPAMSRIYPQGVGAVTG